MSTEIRENPGQPGCDGPCQKLDSAWQIVASGSLGEAVKFELSRPEWFDPLREPVVSAAVGDSALPSRSASYVVLASDQPRDWIDPRPCVRLVGDAPWLSAALHAIGRLIEDPGIICIDLIDLYAVFRAGSAIRGVAALGQTAGAAGAAAIAAAGPDLARATSVLAHFETDVNATLYDVNETFGRITDCMADSENALFNFYVSERVGVHLTLLLGFPKT